MIVAGTRLTDTEVTALAGKLRGADMSECADRMEKAYVDGEHLFFHLLGRTSGVLDALADCPDELLPLRARLLEPLV